MRTNPKRKAMTIVKYRPQGSFVSPFNALMNDFFNRDIGQVFGQDEMKHILPGVNIVENDEAFELRMQVPGFNKQELKLQVENDVLTISAEHKVEDLKENERYTRREFSYGSFTRSFRLPGSVDSANISAQCADGLLTVRIPKTEAAKPRAREIGIN